MKYRTKVISLFLIASISCCLNLTNEQVDSAKKFLNNNSVNNWAVIVSSSKYWHNYRHHCNALSIYRILKDNGMSDDNIILMLADDIPSDSRNIYPGKIFIDKGLTENVYYDDIQVDYRSHEVTPENFVRILTGRHSPGTKKSKQLLSDQNSNILIYMTGHGGNRFLKFRDTSEISCIDISLSILQMELMNRYREMLIIIDTCQAASLYSTIKSKNIIALSSSEVGESSFSHHESDLISVALIDSLTYFTSNFLVSIKESRSIEQLFYYYKSSMVSSTPTIGIFGHYKKISDVKTDDFFSPNLYLELTKSPYPF